MKAQPLIERGLQWCEAPRDVATAVDVVFSMVADDAALDAVTSGSDGILAGLRPGHLYVDMSTVSPRASRAVAQQVLSLGAKMLDAPVSGSIPHAESGTLAIMVGGDEQGFAKVEPLFYESSADSAQGMQRYLETLPNGPHAAAATQPVTKSRPKICDGGTARATRPNTSPRAAETKIFMGMHPS